MYVKQQCWFLNYINIKITILYSVILLSISSWICWWWWWRRWSVLMGRRTSRAKVGWWLHPILLQCGWVAPTLHTTLHCTVLTLHCTLLKTLHTGWPQHCQHCTLYNTLYCEQLVDVALYKAWLFSLASILPTTSTSYKLHHYSHTLKVLFTISIVQISYTTISLLLLL